MKTNDSDEQSVEMLAAMTRYTLLSAAASVLSVPTVVFTTPPMVEPPAVTLEEKEQRNASAKVLDEFWNFSSVAYNNSTKHQHEEEATGSDPCTYGEITKKGARQLFHYLKLQHETCDVVFYDLGSGLGRLVAQAYLEVPNLSRACGIELDPLRHSLAVKSWTMGRQECERARNSMATANKDAVIQFEEDSFFNSNLSKATHVYVASLCVSEQLLEQLATKLIAEAHNLKCVASLKEFPKGLEPSLGGPPQVEYVEMSWTRPNGSIVFFYWLNR